MAKNVSDEKRAQTTNSMQVSLIFISNLKCITTASRISRHTIKSFLFISRAIYFLFSFLVNDALNNNVQNLSSDVHGFRCIIKERVLNCLIVHVICKSVGLTRLSAGDDAEQISVFTPSWEHSW